MREPGWRARARRFLPAAVGLGFFLLLFRRGLGDAILVRRDALILYLAIKQFLAEELHAGRIPTWYPYDSLGLSYVGSSVAGLFHPGNLLYLVLAPAQGLKWQSLLCYPFAACGTFKLARRLGSARAGALLAGLGFAGSGYLLGVSDNLPYLLTAAALPWSLLAAERLSRRPDLLGAVVLALALGLALSGGDIQGALLQALAAGAVVLAGRPGRWREKILGLGIAGGLLILLALPLLLPVWATFHGSVRAQGLAANKVLTWPLHPLRFLELALGPHLPSDWLTDGDPLVDLLGGTDGSTWARSELLGLPAVALALAALLRPLPRRLKIIAGMGALALVLATGKFLGLYPLFMRAVPLWGAFRYPEKLMPFALIALAVLAGWGTRRLVRADPRATRLFGMGLLGLIGWMAVCSPSRLATLIGARVAAADAPDATVLAELSSNLRFHAVLGLLALGALALLSVKGGRWTGCVAVALNCLQVLLLSGWIVGFAPSPWAHKHSPYLPAVQQQLAQGTGRLCWSVKEYDYANPPDLDSEHTVLDANLRVLAPVSGRWHVGNTRAYFPGNNGFFIAACDEEVACASACSRVAAAGIGMLDAKDFAALPPSAGVEALQREEDPRTVLFRDPRARPFASLPAVRHVSSELAQKAVFDPARDVRTEAIVIGSGADLPAPGGTLAVTRNRPDRIEAHAELPAPGLAVFAESCERGWRAEVDGHDAPLEKADGIFCAVPLSAGAHQVQLDYRPFGWPFAFLGPALFALVAGLGFRRAWSSRAAA